MDAILGSDGSPRIRYLQYTDRTEFPLAICPQPLTSHTTSARFAGAWSRDRSALLDDGSLGHLVVWVNAFPDLIGRDLIALDPSQTLEDIVKLVVHMHVA